MNLITGYKIENTLIDKVGNVYPNRHKIVNHHVIDLDDIIINGSNLLLDDIDE